MGDVFGVRRRSFQKAHTVAMNDELRYGHTGGDDQQRHR
jgi:hypothetical protein